MDGTVAVFDLATCTLTNNIHGHNKAVRSLEFTPGKKLMMPVLRPHFLSPHDRSLWASDKCLLVQSRAVAACCLHQEQSIAASSYAWE